MIYIAAVTAFLTVVLLSPIFIAKLKSMGLTQPIRRELPPDHQAKKGTPLMFGGILFVGIIIAMIVEPGRITYFLAAAFALFGFIGFLDDYRKASRQDPGGISGKLKLIAEFLITGLLLAYLINAIGVSTDIAIFKTVSINLPVSIYIIVATLFIVGSANAINFTDGLDGLLGVVSLPTYAFFFAITRRPEIQAFCLIMIACVLGFLLYNKFPAKAFMGDTGSLAIGGSLSFLAVIEKVEILIPVLFFIYFAEQLSVIVQVFVFKRTGKRFFKMTPIHYHFGLKYGWSENRIVIIFGAVSLISAVICLTYRSIFLTPFI